jgi:uncharacterized protein YjbJ (UPF0337 family)
MDWSRVEGNWKQLKGNNKEQWGKLTDDDLNVINGRRDQLEGKIQERYGYQKDQVRLVWPTTMQGHVFKVGDIVRLRTSGMAGRGAVYHVRQCLPAGPDGDVLYRVKAEEELHERIARQTELVPLAAPQGDAPAAGEGLFGRARRTMS